MPRNNRATHCINVFDMTHVPDYPHSFFVDIWHRDVDRKQTLCVDLNPSKASLERLLCLVIPMLNRSVFDRSILMTGDPGIDLRIDDTHYSVAVSRSKSAAFPLQLEKEEPAQN